MTLAQESLSDVKVVGKDLTLTVAVKQRPDVFVPSHVDVLTKYEREAVGWVVDYVLLGRDQMCDLVVTTIEQGVVKFLEHLVLVLRNAS